MPLRPLLLQTLLDVALAAVLMLALVFLLSGLVSLTAGAPSRRVETWSFTRVPPDDAPLRSWASQEKDLRSLRVERLSPTRLRLRYERPGLWRASVPWTRLGYRGASLATPDRKASIEEQPDPRLTILSVYALQAALFAVGLWMTCRGGSGAPLFAGSSARALASGLLLGACLVLLSAAYAVAVRLLFGEDALPDPLPFNIRQFSPAQQVLMALCAVGFAPLAEELFFRAGLFGSYWRAGHAAVGLLLSSLLFGAAHQQPVLFPVLAAYGVLLALAYRRTGNLLTPVAAHAVNNGLALVALYNR